MHSLILKPNAAGSQTNLTAVPGGRANYQCVYDYPSHLNTEAYVFAENNTLEDLYDCGEMVATQNVSIENVSVNGVAKRENDTQACTAEVEIYPATAAYYGDAETLTEEFVEYLHSWNFNPESDLFWTIADVNGIEAGCRLDSGGAGCEAQLTQLFVDVGVEIVGEYITNYSPWHKDSIQVNQNFSVIAQEDNGRTLYDATTIRIDYKAPDGTEGSFNGDCIDGNRILAPVPAASNVTTGKFWFKFYAVLASGAILEGRPFFVNIRSGWI